MTPLDHIFAVAFVFLHPLAGFVSYRRLMHRIELGARPDRLQLYRNTIVTHWALFILAILLWSRSQREWTDLGFGVVFDWQFLAAAALTVLGIALFAWQSMQVIRADQQTINKLASQLGRLELLIPHTRNEMIRFYWVSVSAGIVEELLWRGFFIWYLTQFLPLTVAAVISAAGFGLAHAYQGVALLPRVASVGAVFVALYLLSGSIWLPMVLHAAIDMLQGRLAFELVHRRNAAAPGEPGEDQAVNS